MRFEDRNRDRSRLIAYFVVALVALIAGLVIGRLGLLESEGASRIGWPHFSQSSPR